MEPIPELSCIQKGSFFYVQKYNASWLLLNYLNLNVKYEAWESLDEAKLSFKPYRYSILSYLTDKYKINGEFEFLLEYPEHNGYNRWYQTSNPLQENETVLSTSKKAEGYRPHTITWEDNYWGGLVSSSYDNVLLDGSTYHGYTFYSIGRTVIYEQYGIASFDNKNTRISILWVRVPYIPFYTCQTSFHIKINLFPFILIMFK